MNKTLDDAMLDIEKAKAVMYAYEKTYLDLEVAPEEREKADFAISMFYVLRDIIDELADKLELLSGGCHLRRERCSPERWHLENGRLSEAIGPGASFAPGFFALLIANSLLTYYSEYAIIYSRR